MMGAFQMVNPRWAASSGQALSLANVTGDDPFVFHSLYRRTRPASSPASQRSAATRVHDAYEMHPVCLRRIDFTHDDVSRRFWRNKWRPQITPDH